MYRILVITQLKWLTYQENWRVERIFGCIVHVCEMMNCQFHLSLNSINWSRNLNRPRNPIQTWPHSPVPLRPLEYTGYLQGITFILWVYFDLILLRFNDICKVIRIPRSLVNKVIFFFFNYFPESTNEYIFMETRHYIISNEV